MLFKVDIHDEGETLRLVLAGELDMAGVRAFQDGIAESGTAWKNLVIELTDVAFMDSTGLAALIAADEEARGRGGVMTLVRPSQPVMHLLELTGLEVRFAVRR